MGIRTTVVLDDDVLERVREKAREDAVTFRTKINDLIRDGLTKASGHKPPPFEIQAFKMGKYTLPFPIRLSDIDAMEDGAKLRRLG